MAAAHARHQVHDIEIGARRDGTMLAVRDHIWVDLGAYNSWGIVLPYNTVAHLLGPHRVANFDVECRGVVTNKTPNAPYRGAGRPEAVFAMDRIVDVLARDLRMDPAELRRKNYLSAADLPYEIDLPYRDGNPLVYDSGDFRAALDAALGAVDYGALRKKQAALRARGIHHGIGISGYVEGTAIGPYEGATVQDGRVGSRGGRDGRGEPGPGAGDLVRPGGRGRPRHSDRVGDRDRRRHGGHPVRHRHLREPERGERGQLDSRGRGPGQGQARRRGGGALRGGAGRRRDRRRHGVRCAARRPRRCRWGR